jgi:AsmA protein
VNVTLAATGGVVHLFPLQAQVDGGQYSGNIVFDRRAPVPLLTLDERLLGIDVGRLAGTAAKRVHLAGRADLTLRASAHGAESDAILNTLNGRLDAVVHDGALEGVDIGYQLARADALLEGQNAAAATDTRRTPFAAMSMTADITNGVAQTHDLTIASPVFKVTGQGSLDLPTQVLDLSLLAQSSRTGGTAPLQIPIAVTGTTADPVVRPDLDALIKGELGRRVKDVLRDKLKGLFNR